ncbi:MFS transporter [Kribbella caucasensis]|uniref:MFS transporter n=1 Tax=Kribbella caucasensis TaxID=2512215 RepID=UPI001EDCCB04|nr:MFS transporter [Kribbella sp. VKM Ac-2527]
MPFLGVVLTVELGASLAEAGLILAAFGAATIPSRVFGGYLADRLGRKPTIVLGLLGCAVGQTWIALSGTLWSAIPAVVVLGLAFEIYEPPSQAMIADVTEPADRPAAYGLLGAAMAAAGVVAGVLAAALSGWDLRWLFAIDALTCLTCATLVAFALPEGRPARHEATRQAALALPAGRPARREPKRQAAVWRDRRLLLMLGSGTVFATLYMQLVAGLPLTFIERDLPASGIGIVLAVSAVTLILGQRLLRTSLDDFTCMAIGHGLLGVGLLCNGFAQNLPGFIAAAVVWSLGELLLMGRYYTIVSALAPDHAHGRYLAFFGLSWGIATIIAPLATTQFLSATGPTGLWITCAAAAAILASAQPAIRRRISDKTLSSVAPAGS